MSCTGNRGQSRGRNRRLAAVATDQGGVVSLDQLLEIDISRRAAAYRAEEGQLHRLHRGVYAVGHESLGRAETLRAAVLACGEGSAISHGTAAAFWGLRDYWPQMIDVTVPCQTGRKVDGIYCRRCRYPSPGEIEIRNGVSTTTPARTLIDMAGILTVPSMCQVVERAAVLKLLDLDSVNRSLNDAQGRPGLKGLRRILSPWYTDDGTVPDVRSDFEALVLPRLIAMGLPRPTCNMTLWIDGEKLIVDFLWEDRWVVVETDGAASHQTPVAFQRDRKRDQILVAAGYRVARATWDQVTHELDSVVARISRTLALIESNPTPPPPTVR